MPGPRKVYPDALAHYLKAVHNPDTVHAMCEDYRAGATIDTQLDEADRGRRKITCPSLVLWGLQGKLGKWYDVLEIWRIRAEDIRGVGLNWGYYLAEYAPEGTNAFLNA